MANFHSRSKSLPSKSHPVMDDVEDHLWRLKSSANTSTSSTSICANLASLIDLHERINDLICTTSIQQALSNELLEGSLRLVDLCGVSRDVVCLTKESVQELESSIRRKSDDINAYVASRKKISKMVNKCIKNLKSFNLNSTANSDKDNKVISIGTMLKETEAVDFSVLKSVLILLSGGKKGRSKQRSWSLLSKFSQTSRIHCEIEQEGRADDLCCLDIHKSNKSISLKQLKASEMIIQELEEGLEALFRSLIKTRVSLLNVLSN